MKKKMNFVKLLNILSVTLFVCFIIKTTIDYIQYSSLFNSAPFSAWVIVNALYFIIPSIVVLITGLVIKRNRKY